MHDITRRCIGERASLLQLSQLFDDCVHRRSGWIFTTFPPITITPPPSSSTPTMTLPGPATGRLSGRWVTSSVATRVSST
ncbi:hypothetical protein [Nocardia sp. NPDC005998]|uniref:hypothetical protein n=1 Tax=Nocardia sp. NPDC005998 TaxID=3156894 RepID=UPI0033B4EE4C